MSDWLRDLEAKGFRVTVTSQAQKADPVQTEADRVAALIEAAQARDDARTDRLVAALEAALHSRPVVNISPPEVHVAAPMVTVEAAKAAELAPVINVNVPDTQTIDIRSMPRQRRTIKRDREGEITEVIDE